jgi:hypothetical protein
MVAGTPAEWLPAVSTLPSFVRTAVRSFFSTQGRPDADLVKLKNSRRSIRDRLTNFNL